MTSPKLSLTRRYLQTTRTLSEALPYMRQFTGHTFVIKYGGHAMGSDEVMLNFARDVVLLKQVGINPIVVHGGGPQIGEMLKRLNIPTSFVDGLRVTDKAAVEVVEMVLSGAINKEIVGAIGAAGGTAVGLSGKDGRLIEARQLTRTVRDPDSLRERVLDYGFVGEPVAINARLLQSLAGLDVIPVIAPVGFGAAGETFNVNADTVAGSVAAAMHASKLLLLTDVPGVLDQQGKLIPTLTAEQARAYIADGTVSGGMIPKVQTCIDSVLNGAGAAHILDGRVQHVLLLEIFTEQGIGTMLQAV
ncbi:MAG: acetylglutamate kinase [Alphaproteobacteria bacterium]|nr:acetylglutamate kinase [Alphaproteobacteria bacterium]